jgi:hypothetical protein
MADSRLMQCSIMARWTAKNRPLATLPLGEANDRFSGAALQHEAT